MLIIGKFLKTHGVRGQIKVKSYSNNSDDIKYFKEFYVEEHKMINLNFIGKIDSLHICTINHYQTIDEIKPFIGNFIFIKKKELPSLENNSFYYYELEGLDVILNKKKIGKIIQINNHGAGDYFEIKIKQSKKIILVPYNNDHVSEVSLESNFIVLNSEYYKHEF